jgi:hypothetical protein
VQPRRLRAVQSGAWWSYEGPLAIVFSGLADGTLVLPVRLPTAPSNQPILDHHLADPSRWHKVDLVRCRDPQVPGGWRFEAHLMVLVPPYVSPRVAARRATAAMATMDRAAGIDVNVSNITVASHASGGDVRVTRIERDATQRQRDRGRARRERRRLRALDRSRRAMNRAQYQLSKRQEKRARRRVAAGLPAVNVIPMGPRVARADGVPVQGYRRDELSASYSRGRAAQAADAASTAQARRDRARQVAAERRGRARVPARRRGHEHRGVVPLLGTRGGGVLARVACRGDQSRGECRRRARGPSQRGGACGHATHGAVPALPLRCPRPEVPVRPRPSLSGLPPGGRS